jgi:hypothetical protein
MISENVLLKAISTNCPICNSKMDFKINPEIVQKAKNYPVAISLMHCNFTIIVYVDANFRVRGVESAVTFQNSEASVKKYKIPELKPESEFEDRVYYIRNRSHADFLQMDIPNLLEKQILLTISKNEDYISIRELMEKMKKVGKALNLNVNEALIEKVVSKYTKEGLISKYII